MRPSSKPTGEVWRLLSEWSRDHEFRPNQTQMAGLFGVSTSLMSNWKFMESVMQADDMQLISEKTGIDIGLIARAVAEDRDRGVMGNAEHPAENRTRGDYTLSARRSRTRKPRGPQEQQPD